MFGYIKKSKISEHIKRAEKRASKKTAKQFHTEIRKKNNELRKMRQFIRKVQRGYSIYRKQRNGYEKVVVEMGDRLYGFQNEINKAIGILKGGLDEVDYKIYLDKGHDTKILKLIK